MEEEVEVEEEILDGVWDKESEERVGYVVTHLLSLIGSLEV